MILGDLILEAGIILPETQISGRGVFRQEFSFPFLLLDEQILKVFSAENVPTGVIRQQLIIFFQIYTKKEAFRQRLDTTP